MSFSTYRKTKLHIDSFGMFWIERVESECDLELLD